MIRPNFFILGAPKCGTTSVAAWLSEHQEVYMSPTKEPHFFNTDHKRFLNSLESYRGFSRTPTIGIVPLEKPPSGTSTPRRRCRIF